MTNISPLAHIDSKARIADDAAIGPFCFIGPDVLLGPGTKLHNNVTITGHTTVGENNEFYPGCVLGAAPQDLKYRGEPTRLVIGNGNVFRELVTIHPGTEVAGGITEIGNDNRVLIGVHIAHDCRIVNACIFANYIQCAGHVHVEDYVSIGGIAGVHHFVTLGKHSFIAGFARITIDIPPFVIAAGLESRIRALNMEGLKRKNFTEVQLKNLRSAYRVLFSKRAREKNAPLDERIASLEHSEQYDENVEYLCAFVRRSVQEGIHGRFLESKRQDTEQDRKEFYEKVLERPESSNAAAQDS